MLTMEDVRLTADRVDFHIGDVLFKFMRLRGLKQKDIADRSGRRPNTISDVFKDGVETEEQTINDVLRVLNVDRDEAEKLLKRMNGRAAEVVPFRTHDERDEDKDDRKKEAGIYARRIAKLPDFAQTAIFNVVRAFESLLPPGR